MTSILHVQDLLKLSGESFVRAGYATLLGREPDAVGLAHYLIRLQQGYGRAAVLAEIAKSKEARIKAVDLPGLKEVLREYDATRSWWSRIITMPTRYERSLNRIEELVDALRESSKQTERDLYTRQMGLEAAMLAQQSGEGQIRGGAKTSGDAIPLPTSRHHGQQGQMWLKRIRSIQGWN